jgi:hypothetical protein
VSLSNHRREIAMTRTASVPVVALAVAFGLSAASAAQWYPYPVEVWDPPLRSHRLTAVDREN